MPDTKFGRYFITETPPNPLHPETRDKINDMGVINTLWISDELQGILKGAFYLETTLVVRPSLEEKPGAKTHSHDWDEYLVFLGTNPEDPFDLGGEIEFWLGDEKHIVTKSCAIFIPRGIEHGPLYTRRVDRPFISFSVGNTLRYLRQGNDNPE